MDRVSGEFMAKLDETLDSIYDEYEIFNFDITFFIQHTRGDRKGHKPAPPHRQHKQKPGGAEIPPA
ncbi:MAG: hypothetical protein Q9N34_00940 [Aquificota bacterium]|nr:hypothetical protein [Aquificota bacterium]